jgi:hypothetical protein
VLVWSCSLRSGKALCNLLAKLLSKVNDQSGYPKVIVICNSCERSTKRDLPTKARDKPRLAAASCRRASTFAGQLTSYNTRHIQISCSLARQYSQVNLPARTPDTPRLAAASRVNVRRSTYSLGCWRAPRRRKSAGSHRGCCAHTVWLAATCCSPLVLQLCRGGMPTSTCPIPPRPTSAARAPAPAHLSRTHARIPGRSTKSGSGTNGTVEKGSRGRAGRSASWS